MSKTKLICGVLTGFTNPGIDTFLSIEEYDFYEIDGKIIGYDLPKNYTLGTRTEFDLIFIEDSAFQILEKKYPKQYNKILKKLRKLTRKNLLIGVGGRDWLQLSNPPEAYEEVDLILKTTGVFKDKELYNYHNGACSTNRDWLSKEKPLLNKYPLYTLDKLRPSFSCMITIHRQIRDVSRKFLPHLSVTYRQLAKIGDWLSDMEIKLLQSFKQQPNLFLHCIGGVTHYQRIELMQQLRQYNYSGNQWLSPFKDDYLWEFGRRPLTEEEKKEIDNLCKQHHLYGPRLSRSKFKRNLLNHQVILAPTGYGELTYRHGEAWKMKRTLLCQDLSHVEMIYPIENEQNAFFCKSDFSDLQEKLQLLQSDKKLCEMIAQNGYRLWNSWDYKKHLDIGVKKYIKEICQQQLPQATATIEYSAV